MAWYRILQKPTIHWCLALHSDIDFKSTLLYIFYYTGLCSSCYLPGTGEFLANSNKYKTVHLKLLAVNAMPCHKIIMIPCCAFAQKKSWQEITDVDMIRAWEKYTGAVWKCAMWNQTKLYWTDTMLKKMMLNLLSPFCCLFLSSPIMPPTLLLFCFQSILIF